MSNLAYTISDTDSTPIILEDKKIANSYFKDDVWDLSTILNHKRTNVASIRKLNFKPLGKKQLIVEPIKYYCYLRLGEVKPMTVANIYAMLVPKLLAFMEEYQLNSLESFNKEYFLLFNQWLKRHSANSKPNTLKNLASIANTLLQIITTGQSFKLSHLPKEPIILEISVWQWWRALGSNNNKMDRSIPLNIWKNILKKAWSEPSITQTIKRGRSAGLIRINNVKFAILIQAYTGLRISEVLYLKKGSVEKDQANRCWLEVEIEKTQIEPTSHKILIPNKIYTLIQELEKLTQPLREEAQDKEYLFYILSKVSKKTSISQETQRFKPITLESGKYNHYLLRPFLKRNNLALTFINIFNEEIKISSHCFRHTYANIAVAQQNINPTVLQTHFKHLSIEMTMHYINLKKEEIKNAYIKGMIDSGNIYTQGKEGNSFKKIISKNNNNKDITSITENISKMFGINPLPFGLCLFDFKRGHCPHLGVQSCYKVDCSDFITNKSFLLNFQHEKEILEKQLNHCNQYGYMIEAKKTYSHLQKVETIIKNIQE